MLDEIWDFIIESIGGFFESVGDAIGSIGEMGDSPLGNVWFWLFYICLLAGVWILPSKFGLLDYKLWEKLLYTVLFFIIDYFLVSHFQS